ncbi:hypothetical protein [Nostoc sp. DSM 114161]|jgi:hypothetical protein|uniref:hypothetical protein n=1 Tax=Nostoc sp. DSM 114161 TaxID=3440143 RepID=UPI004045C2ED
MPDLATLGFGVGDVWIRDLKLRIFLLNISINLAVAIGLQIGISDRCGNYCDRKTLYQV